MDQRDSKIIEQLTFIHTITIQMLLNLYVRFITLNSKHRVGRKHRKHSL